jgi:uncharacterized UPF0160 family protein
MTKKTCIVTHDSGFHADDVFGVAALTVLLGEENIEVRRSRDPEVIAQGEYVLDVGMVYDPATNHFDHHQEGGAGQRENGIPYASFGLIWKHFGERIAGSKEVADAIDRCLVQPIDAHDNGVDFFTLAFEGVSPYTIGQFLGALGPAWGESATHDAAFREAVLVARRVIDREIVHAQKDQEAIRMIDAAYAAADKKIVIIDSTPAVPRTLIQKRLSKYPESLYAIRNHEESGTWQVVTVLEDPDSFKSRRPLPLAWAGKRDHELASLTGVSDAYFCHNARFMCLARSKEGALKLAQLALEA